MKIKATSATADRLRQAPDGMAVQGQAVGQSGEADVSSGSGSRSSGSRSRSSGSRSGRREADERTEAAELAESAIAGDVLWPDGLQPVVNAIQDGIWLHGGVPCMKVGDVLLPPTETAQATLLRTMDEFAAETGQDVGHVRRDKVYCCRDRADATMFAGTYPHGGVYVVVPQGVVEHDPDCYEMGASVQCDRAVIVQVLRSGNATRARKLRRRLEERLNAEAKARKRR